MDSACFVCDVILIAQRPFRDAVIFRFIHQEQPIGYKKLKVAQQARRTHQVSCESPWSFRISVLGMLSDSLNQWREFQTSPECPYSILKKQTPQQLNFDEIGEGGASPSGILRIKAWRHVIEW
jgi:hypothetical protein